MPEFLNRRSSSSGLRRFSQNSQEESLARLLSRSRATPENPTRDPMNVVRKRATYT